jgi:diguanylate cyclase (GGDEF)-like protein
MKRIAVIGAPADVGADLQLHLQRDGWQVAIDTRIEGVQAELAKGPFDLVVVDAVLESDPEWQKIAVSVRQQSPIFRWELAGEAASAGEGATVDTPMRSDRAAACAAAIADWWLEHRPASNESVETEPVLSVANSAGAFLAELEKARLDFFDSVPAKIEKLAEALRRGMADAKSLEVARGLAHKLRGSAGSYGLGELGTSAGRIEELIVAARDSGDLHDAAFADDFARASERLLAKLSALYAQQVRHRQPAGEGGETVGLPAILVCDSDESFVLRLNRIAQAHRLEILAAKSEAQALAWANKRTLAGVLLTIEGDGRATFELARQIRESAGNETVSLAVAAAQASIETRVAAVHAGASSFLDKPVPDHVLAQVVASFAEASSARAGHVFLVDDDPDISAHFMMHLEAIGIAVETHDSAMNLFEKLERSNPDVLLLDLDLPNGSGLELCRAVRMSVRWQLMPVLIISGRIDAQTRLEAYRAGASDVISKPVLPEELRARVLVQLERVRLNRERAEKDSLSGLLLRRAFVEGVERMLAVCQREARPLTLVLLDLDHFKRINDTYGHLAGDDVIRVFGEILRRRFRLEDLRGRWGGEEFILAFAGQNAEFGVKAATQLLLDFSDTMIETEDGKSFRASFTAGVASYPADGEKITDLVKVADERLYQGKLAGRGRVCSKSAAAS